MNKGADRKRGLVRITRQVHVDLDVFFIQVRVLLVDVADGLGGVPYVVSGDREHPDFPVSEARQSRRENRSILIGLRTFRSLGGPRALRRRLGETWEYLFLDRQGEKPISRTHQVHEIVFSLIDVLYLRTYLAYRTRLSI